MVAEYVEAESGKRSDRPKLAKALAHVKAIGATAVFAKLDRLTRNVDLLRWGRRGFSLAQLHIRFAELIIVVTLHPSEWCYGRPCP